MCLIVQTPAVETQATVSTANTGSLTPPSGSSSAEGRAACDRICAPPHLEPLTKASAECCTPQVGPFSIGSGPAIVELCNVSHTEAGARVPRISSVSGGSKAHGVVSYCFCIFVFLFLRDILYLGRWEVFSKVGIREIRKSLMFPCDATHLWLDHVTSPFCFCSSRMFLFVNAFVTRSECSDGPSKKQS